MSIGVSGIGLATAQGGCAEVRVLASPHPASELLWTPNRWNVSRWCYPALGIDPTLTGVERWRALAKKALDDLGDTETPLLVASCNGSAAGFQTETWEQAFDTSALLKDTPWAGKRLPVFSSSCASGIHALFAAQQLLASGALDEVLVLAVDIVSQSNHDNFEGLRVLADKPGPPWQSTSTGFILGEAAVAIRLTRHDESIAITLASDLDDHDGLCRVLEAISPRDVSLIVGQGTGPFENDRAELAAFSEFVGKDVPVTTPLTHFGHTLGASALLSVALGVLNKGNVLITCRALNGACAAAIVGRSKNTDCKRNDRWHKTLTPGPLMNPTLKRLASEALDHRPSAPPDVLILRLERPLSPPASAFIGKRLLPSAVLEITPGLASQLIARRWGFTGAALCLVGDVDADVYGLKNALRESGSDVFQVNLRGSGDNRAIEWNA